MSGLYNALFGYNPLAGRLLQILNLNSDQCGRFRDCYLRPGEEGSGPIIVVYNRCGGPNRESYLETFEELAKHPNYIRDRDADHDSTYAYVEFSVPEQAKIEVRDALRAIAETNPDLLKGPDEKFKEMMDKLDKLQSGNINMDDPMVKRAMAVGREVLGKVVEAAGVPLTDTAAGKQTEDKH